MVLIRDLSHWDDQPINYGEYDGLIIRCYSGIKKDDLFDKHVTGAEIAVKPWWPYSFYDFRYPAEPQVKAALAILGDEAGYLPLMFDVEEWRYWDYVKEEWVWIRYPGRIPLLNGLNILYQDYLDATGKICQFYVNPATIHYLKPVPDWLLSCTLHIAHWGMVNPDYEPWPKWTFHQYQGEPDLNRFNGTDEEYWKYIGGTPPAPPFPPIPATGLKMKVLIKGMHIREAPNVAANEVGHLRAGEILEVLDVGGTDVWIKHSDGWSAKQHAGTKYMEKA